MIPAPLLVLNLAVAIAIVLGTILLLRWSPMIALVLGSIFMGLACGLGVENTAERIATGFGELMAGIGLSIGFGIIIGRLLVDCGGAHALASAIVRRVPRGLVFYGIGLAAFLFSIPVFFDVTFVILVPLAVALSAELRKPLPYAIGAMVIGAATAHTLVPPTPNPLAAASILGFDLGVMVIAGLLVGLPAALVAMKVYFVLLDRGLWNAKRDEAAEGVPPPLSDAPTQPVRLPPAGLALVPIVTPIVLILLGTVWSAASNDPPPRLVLFLGNKVFAMFLGAVAAHLVAYYTLTRRDQETSVAHAMGSAGVVLLVTGAGGSFGAVIKATGIGDVLADGIAGTSNSALVGVLATYAIAAVFRVSQGSGTVASITTMTIIAGADLAARIGLHPVWLALAALSGGISIGHVNDSGFWVTTRLSGLTVSGGFKTYTLGEFVVSVLVLAITVAGCLLWPRLA
jgi:H+/gluconate symporter-like permease